MGWNSWNHFAERIDDKTVRAQADAMVGSGLKDAGYVYINIDDTWEGKRDAAGRIQPNQKFPNMKALADYVSQQGAEARNLLLPGGKILRGLRGQLGTTETEDAETYAEWGIDYLKYDWCQPTGSLEDMRAAYAKMRAAPLRRPGAPSSCRSASMAGSQGLGVRGATVGGNQWRTTGDITDQYRAMAGDRVQSKRTGEICRPRSLE